MQLIEIKETPSTNLHIKQNRSSFKHGDCVFTHNQTAGRGQAGNSWHTESGKNMTASLLLEWYKLPIEKRFTISQMIAISILSELKTLLPNKNVQIKWPNDVLVDGKKIAGILIENNFHNKYISESIIGVGLNINQTDFSTLLPKQITSLKSELGISQSIEQIILRICQSILDEYNSGMINHPSSINRIYLNNLYRFEEWAKYKDKNGTFEGKIITLLPDGRISILHQSDRQAYFYDIKEVEFL
jgi:BirA family biotin operon repressor/biotin-[acetyl-CoA-carboxylase] ligase